ncbi:MAG: hypothetical protein HYX84_07250 [Chloroflexi bacterium]|nr:hypothetical protein [Chloroflexota bacterium]
MMLRHRKELALTVCLMALPLVFAGCSTGYTSQPGAGAPAATSPSILPVQPTNGIKQSNEGGAVTISAELMGMRDSALVFRVTMDTHSVDLDRYDFKELAELRDDAGNQFQPITWDAAPGGHHRQGTLTFPVPDTLTQGKARYVEVVIREVTDVRERVLRWEL